MDSTYSDYLIFFENNLILKNKVKLLQYENILNPESFYILKEIGLPKKTEFFDFPLDDKIERKDNIVIINRLVAETQIILNLNKNEEVSFGIEGEESGFINSSLKSFIFCIYEYEKFIKEIIEPNEFGNFYPNRMKYANYIIERLCKIDYAVTDYSKGYFWGSIFEKIELGY